MLINETIVILKLIISVITILSLWYLIVRAIDFYKDKKIKKEREKILEIHRLEQEKINSEKDWVDKRFNEWYQKYVQNYYNYDIEDEELDHTSQILFYEYIVHLKNKGDYGSNWHMVNKHLKQILREKYTYET